MIRIPIPSWQSLLAFFLATTPSFALAQGGEWTTSWSIYGSDYQQGFGKVLQILPDIDLDGEPEVGIGSPFAFLNSIGRVMVLSGTSHIPVYDLYGTSSGGQFGQSMAGISDYNHDGFPDFIIGEPVAGTGFHPSGICSLFSGAWGIPLLTIQGSFYGIRGLGDRLISTQDLNGNGTTDILARSAENYLAIDGRSGGLIWMAPSPQGDFFSPILSLDYDLDGDSITEFVVGEITSPVVSGMLAGHVALLSGSTGRIIWESTPGQLGLLGNSLALLSDLNGDGIPEILAGEPDDTLADHTIPSEALILSGSDGHVLRVHYPTSDKERMGICVVGLSYDLDGDFINDYGISFRPYFPPSPSIDFGVIRFFSGQTGAFLSEIEGPIPFTGFGEQVISLPVTAQHRYPELLVSSSWEDSPANPGAGMVQAFQFHPFLTLSSHQISVSSGPTVAVRSDFPDTEAGKSFVILASSHGRGPTILSGVSVPLTRDGLFDQLLGGWQPPFVQYGVGVLDSH